MTTSPATAAARIQAGKDLLPQDLRAALDAADSDVAAAGAAARFAATMVLEAVREGQDDPALEAERVRWVERFDKAAGRMERLIAEAQAWVARTFSDSTSPPG